MEKVCETSIIPNVTEVTHVAIVQHPCRRSAGVLSVIESQLEINSKAIHAERGTCVFEWGLEASIVILYETINKPSMIPVRKWDSVWMCSVWSATRLERHLKINTTRDTFSCFMKI